MEKQMAVKGPTPIGISIDKEAQPLGWLDQNCVLKRPVFAMAVFKLAEHPVQMHWMSHHGVVDQDEAHALAITKHNRLGRFGIFFTVKAPHEAVHIAGQMEHDVA